VCHRRLLRVRAHRLHRRLKLIFFSPSLGEDVFSDDGTCTITFAKADASGTDGSVTCPAVRGDGTRITTTADLHGSAGDRVARYR
jgi:hypothetical protein